MAEGPELNKTEARGGTRGPNRTVMVVSLLLVIAAFTAIYLSFA